MNPSVLSQAFIARHTGEIRPLRREVALACWEASRSGRAEDFERMAALEKQMVDIYSRPGEFAEIARCREALPGESDPLLARQIDLIYLSYKSCQGDKELMNRLVDLEAALAREFNTFRALFRNEKRSNNYLIEILRNTRDGDEAREAWEALKQVGTAAAPRVIELVRLRNQHARSLGSPNYYALALEIKELEQDKLFALLDDLEKHSAPLFRRLKENLDKRLAKEFGITTEELRPWHYRDPFFQDMPTDEVDNLDPVFADQNIEALTERFYAGIGLDIRPILERSDLYEREGKDQHAFCIGVENPEDVRVLCNIRPSERWMSTMLHEFGHAVYDHGIAPELPYLLRQPAHALTTEAVAMLNERFLKSAAFLNRLAGMPISEAEKMERMLRRRGREKMLVFLRWALVMIHFERALYEDPEQDLCGLWWRMVERFQWLNGADRRNQPDWAAKIHLASAPVYYQNYLLGEMNASQILAALRRECSENPANGGEYVENPQAGAFLQNKIFRHGAARPWNQCLEQATGELLNPRFYLADIATEETD